LPHGSYFVLRGDRVDFADPLIEFLFGVCFDHDVEAIVANHLGIGATAGYDLGDICKLLGSSLTHEGGAGEAILDIDCGRALGPVEWLNVMVKSVFERKGS